MRPSLYPAGSVCMLNLTSEGLSPYCSVNQNILVLEKAIHQLLIILSSNPLPHRDAFNTFANRADPDQAAIVRAA